MKFLKNKEINMNNIRKIINEWDPINLFPYAPDDEYSVEIEMIKEGIKKVNNQEELTALIQEIFISQFGNDYFDFSIEESKNISKKIYELMLCMEINLHKLF